MDLHEQSHLLRGILKSPHPLEDMIPSNQKSFLLYLLYYYEDIPESKKVVVNKIIKKLEKTTQVLLPLYKLGFEISVSLIGGSIRDLLLDKEDEIKDLDILLSLDKLKMNKIFDDCPYVKYKEVFGKEILNYLNLADTHELKYHSLIKYCLKDTNNISEYSLITNKTKSRYGSKSINENLGCLIKIEKEHDNDYPLDIMVTHLSVNDYVEKTVDFNICKAYLKFIDVKKFSNIPTDSYSFFNNIVVTKDFLTDAQKKEISLNMNVFNEEQINHFMENHYPQLAKKYIDYNLNLISGSNTKLLALKETYENKYRLDKILDSKEKVGNTYKV